MAIHAASDKSKQLAAILRCLRACGKPTTLTLQQWSGSMCPATRISELRKRGYLINSERDGGIYRYVLIGQLVEGDAA
jgi:hypothetical protein